VRRIVRDYARGTKWQRAWFNVPDMSRRLGAWGLTLALVAVLAAAAVPSCADSLCCKLAGEKTVAPAMPCCEPSMSAGDTHPPPLKVEDRQSGRSASLLAESGQAGLPILHHASLSPPERVQHEPSPPLFLLNAQFRI
jgi:hypothetical protein